MSDKFIIFKRNGVDCSGMRLGMVEFHKDLLSCNETCLGGGFFDIDRDNNVLYLYDKSYDFGYPQFENLKYISEDFQDYKIMYYSLFREDAVPVEKLTNETIEYTDML